MAYEGKSTKTCQQTVSLWNWKQSSWETLDSRSVLGSRTVTGLQPKGTTLADYISGDAGEGEVRIQARCARTSGSFTDSTDVLRVTYTHSWWSVFD